MACLSEEIHLMASTNGVAKVIVIERGFPRMLCVKIENNYIINYLHIFSKLSWDGLTKQLSQGMRRHSSKGTVVSLDEYKA